MTVTLINVKPKERPNVAGLRSDKGPSHAPPLIRSTTPWITPLRISRPPTE